ncbi:MAG: insulinase family protein [Clostridium sp.]|jgi:Zn-dependent M16 (insulinase) family peptidase|uniref:insulinase family protein n=1 Tax=Clostridium sp. TaxID=1506 RepID=UPI0025C4EB45|nr:insulinase family protein [Clostridium sp.]MCH3966015.1 insulinase family protein [Clostridium sp.]MCI1715897.1 insulinase family protein [Clostridium sp.]MCI1800431.1 insulinase family protein [Clostridium sp.]MCI1814074.1 insulinase family protein [Clostridium sp.]MCI1870972.1 insulinase family protein [Clostridium sp.]
MNIGESYSGFKFIEKKDIAELNSTGMIFEHEKSGARLFFLKNDDENKVFAISFRTPPENSKGIPHILEHSVLCGSRKFPVKEPFVELVKGSLNTFLNAFTFPDKTMYPVASVNDRDFENLMDVYLDAVFYPNIYKYPEIMMQEGWHYELDNKDADLTYKGVVYNEMKGAFSSPESILFRKISESLYPDTQYAVESGGDPDVIPELTQDEFLAFHSRYYHPSNSYIYLYGNMDIEEKLKFLNDNYLKEFNRIDVDSHLRRESSFENKREMIINYPISSSEKYEDKTFLSLNYSVGSAVDSKLYLAFDILEHMLLETPSSPLKKALIDANIGKDAFGTFEASMLQPMFSIVVKNSNESEKDRFKELVTNTLQKLVDNGIDEKLVEASINIKEFRLREADYQGYPKGLIYGMKAMDGWLYDAKPWIHLAYEENLKDIKSSLKDNYFEELIEKYILNNNHSSFIMVKPEKGLEEKKEQNLKNELRTFKEKLSEGEVDKIILDAKNLHDRQRTEDKKEDLERIPLLSVSDIEKKAKNLELVEKEDYGVKTLFHPAFTNGIIYVNLYFGSDTVEKELIPYVSLLGTVLGKISTEHYDYGELSNDINIYTGGINFIAESLYDSRNIDVFYPKFIVRSKVLRNNMEKLSKLVNEIVNYSKFDEYKRIKEIIQETKSRMEMIMFDRGHVVAANRAMSYFSNMGKYDDLLNGLGFYKFICDREKNFDAEKEKISANLKKAASLIFNKNNLMSGVTCDSKDYDIFGSSVDEIYGNLQKDDVKHNKYDFKLEVKNEGLMTSGKVQYVAKAYNFRKLGYSYNGSMQVLKSIANYDYLWNQVRVQGGAYGCFSAFLRNGNVFFTSYRDPNLDKTLDVYDSAGEFFVKFEADNRQMSKYIIGTISDLDYPLSPSASGQRAFENFIKNITYEDLQREREEILRTTVENVKKLAPVVSEIMKQNYLCVLGNEQKIKDSENIFSTTFNLFE